MQNLILFTFAGGLVLLQILLGGARLVDALPAYVIIGLAGIATIALRRRPQVQPRLYCLVATLAFAGYVLLRSLQAPVVQLARPDLFLALAGLVVYLVCTLHLSGTQPRFTLTLILMLAVVAHVCVGIAQFKNQLNFMLLPWTYRADFGFRASGFFISPNHLATLLGMLGVFSLSISCWSRVEPATRTFAFYGFIICLTGLALTGSRAGYISTAAGIAFFAGLSVFLAQRFNRPNFFGVAIATALLLTVVVAAVLVAVVRSDIYEKRLRHVHDSSRQAQMLAPAALAQHRLDPVWGTGSGTFQFYGRQFRGPLVQNDPVHVHNEYLELLAEYGWAGVFFFAAFLIAHLVSAIGGLRRVLEQKLKPTAWTASNELALIVGAAAALAIGLVHALADFTFHLPGDATVAAVLFSILANPTVETAGRRERRPLPRWLAVAAPLAGLLLVGLAVPRVAGEVLAERARLALRDHQFAPALELAERVVRRDPANADAFYIAGEARHYLALEAGDPARARDLRLAAVGAFESGLRLYRRDVRLLLKLGRTLDDLGETEQASAVFQRALEAAPDSGIALASVGLHWHRNGNFTKARACYLAAQRLGESEFSPVGLLDLDHDEEVRRANDALSDLLPDRAQDGPPP